MDVSESEEHLEIESPLNLVPDLALLGIEEVDKGVCLDTPENRRLIRVNKLTYSPVYTTAGTDTPLIQVVNGAQRAEVLKASHASLLDDPEDANSDYIAGTDLLLEPDSANLVPVWVMAATRRWVAIERKRLKEGKLINPSTVSAPKRCRAIRSDGYRCQGWFNGSAEYDGLCRVHLTRHSGKDNTALIVKARNRLMSMTPNIVDELEKLAYSADGEPTRLKAMTEILDRAGVRGGVEIDVAGQIEVVPAAETVRERLKKLQAPAPAPEPEILEATVIEEPPTERFTP